MYSSPLLNFSTETGSSDGELDRDVNDLDAQIPVGNNMMHEDMSSLEVSDDMSSPGSTSSGARDDELGCVHPILDTACTFVSPLTNPEERGIVVAILEALNFVDQMDGSHKDFIDVLEFAEELYSRNCDGEDSMKTKWPKSWRETEIIF